MMVMMTQLKWLEEVYEPSGLSQIAIVSHHLLMHHPLDAYYDSIMDDPQLNYYPVSSW
jgi:hypothetical protein